jgi:predicted RecB family nuclease
MAQPEMKNHHWITAKDLYNYTKCLHRVYLDANGDPDAKGEVSRFAKLLWELGLQTERDYLEDLEKGSVTDLSMYEPETAWDKTLEAMGQGVALIYQGCLVHERFRGRPDLLVKRDGAASRWGSYYYEAIDIKAGKGWEERDGRPVKFKEHYAYQMLFYREQLEAIQGYVPPLARIINVDKEMEEFDPGVFEGPYRRAKAQVERLIGGEESSEPVLGSHCMQCEWFKRCHAWVKDTQDPTGIFFVGKIKFGLKEVGLMSVADLARMDVKRYLKPPLKVPRMGERTLRRVKERAQVVLEGKPRFRAGYSFPLVETEIYFDIEDDPTRGVTYLYGLLEFTKGQKSQYRYFLAAQPEDEDRTIRAFWEYLRKVHDVTFYVYSHKERTTLKKLMEKYKLDSSVYEKYVCSEYDLYQKLVVDHSDWPTFSYGIKFIAGQIGFKWRDPDPSGVNSIVWYNDYLADRSRRDILDRLLRYNEDDCRAMVVLKKYFKDQMNDEKIQSKNIEDHAVQRPEG